jgi:hypothetical protein
MYKKSIRSKQETLYVSATNINRLMLFRETDANTFLEHNAEYVEAGGTYINHWDFKV